MKKVLSLLLCMLFGFGIFLAGCSNGLTAVTNHESVTKSLTYGS